MPVTVPDEAAGPTVVDREVETRPGFRVIEGGKDVIEDGDQDIEWFRESFANLKWAQRLAVEIRVADPTLCSILRRHYRAYKRHIQQDLEATEDETTEHEELMRTFISTGYEALPAL